MFLFSCLKCIIFKPRVSFTARAVPIQSPAGIAVYIPYITAALAASAPCPSGFCVRSAARKTKSQHLAVTSLCFYLS